MSTAGRDAPVLLLLGFADGKRARPTIDHSRLHSVVSESIRLSVDFLTEIQPVVGPQSKQPQRIFGPGTPVAMPAVQRRTTPSCRSVFERENHPLCSPAI